ncbi:MAG: Amidohydrolase [Syntrophorhabdus sp. PtaU1.Bin153]|nr:MAG: Amidohydrolase [Syntrophorhabdus sp. PtaU1.Bin153]
MKVDVHAHCYPQPYVKELEKLGIAGEGGVGVKIPVWNSAEERIAAMDKLGIDVQVLNLSAPNVYFPDHGLSKALAQMTNDFLADIVRQHPDRFLSVASIPLANLDDAMAELSRAMNELKMDGIMLGTNINQRPLSDDFFLPFLEEVDRRKVPVVLHPIRSAIEDLMPKEDLLLGIPTSVGFLFETTRTIAQMTFKGTFERFPNLTFILPHSGGAIPFLAPRWDIFYRSRPDAHPLKKLPQPPGHYLRRQYYDIALSYAHSSLRCTLGVVGVDHMVFGTDFPYTNDFRALETIRSIEDYQDLADDEKEKIFFRNAGVLFPRVQERRCIS